MFLAFTKLKMMPSESQTIKPLAKAILHIETNFKKQLTLDALAEISGLSKTYFSHLFNQTFGIGVNEYINNIRLEYAKNQLSTTNELVYTIAKAAGFKSYSLFSKLFKDKYGISPGDYRK